MLDDVAGVLPAKRATSVIEVSPQDPLRNRERGLFIVECRFGLPLPGGRTPDLERPDLRQALALPENEERVLRHEVQERGRVSGHNQLRCPGRCAGLQELGDEPDPPRVDTIFRFLESQQGRGLLGSP